MSLWETISLCLIKKLEVEDYEESITMTTLIRGLRPEKVLWNLSEDPLKSMTKLLAIFERIMKAEEAIVSKRGDLKVANSGKFGQGRDKEKDGKKISNDDRFANSWHDTE